ncbi:MAG: hypothetical protein J6Y17_03025 [Elusimicrobiaceae bacterium]|nr:hypothetical protein [Elusimicrobiaceae bacterium]
MIRNKRGAALLQVLIISAVLAGMATMILRAVLSRTVASRQSRHTVTVQMAIESCMAQVNEIWAAKTPEAYAYDLANCQMCDPTKDTAGGCVATPKVKVTDKGPEVDANKVHVCSFENINAAVYAVMDSGDANSKCKITWYIPGGTDL